MHDTFTASILKSGDTHVKSWAGDKVTVGKVVKFKVLSVSYSRNRLVLLGELDNETMTVRQTVLVAIIEQVDDFEEDSDHHIGIENGHKGNDIEVNTATTVVNGESNCASGSKRKSEEDTDDAIERKKRKKAEKKTRKERERLEERKQGMECSNNANSSNELPADSKQKKTKLLEDSNFLAVLKPDLQVPETPKSKDNASLLALNKPKTPKTPKDNFELPADFKVIERKTEKTSRKIYQGPDGKNYRSMAEVKRHLESSTYDNNNLAETIQFVATEWNCAESGELRTNKNKLKVADVKDFPKSDLYFVDIKPKPLLAKKASNSSKVLTNSTVEATVNDISHDKEITEKSMHDDTVDSTHIKKKKNKKNKNKDSSSFLE